MRNGLFNMFLVRFLGVFLCFYSNGQFANDESKLNFSLNAEASIFNPVFLSPEFQLVTNYTLSNRLDLNLTLGFMFKSVSESSLFFEQVESKRQNHFFYPIYINARYKFNSRWALTLGIGYSFLNYEDQDINIEYTVYNYKENVKKPGLGLIVPISLDFKVMKPLSFYVGLNYYNVIFYNRYSFSIVERKSYFAPKIGVSYHIPHFKKKRLT